MPSLPILLIPSFSRSPILASHSQLAFRNGGGGGGGLSQLNPSLETGMTFRGAKTEGIIRCFPYARYLLHEQASYEIGVDGTILDLYQNVFSWSRTEENKYGMDELGRSGIGRERKKRTKERATENKSPRRLATAIDPSIHPPVRTLAA